MPKRFGYIHSIFNNENLNKQKFSLIASGINKKNIFIDYDELNTDIQSNSNLSNNKNWNKLLKAMNEEDQLFVNSLNDLITKDDVVNINNSYNETLAIYNKISSIIQKKIEIISLGNELIINNSNIKEIFHIMNVAFDIHDNYLHDKSNITNSKINKESNPRRDNSSRVSGNKSHLYKNIYSYVKQGHQKTEAAKKFHVSNSTVYRIIHDFDNLS